MGFLPQFDTIKPDCIKQIATMQVVCEASITPPISAQIGKVMSISAKATINPAETFIGEVRFVGKLHYTIIYVDIDGFNRCIEHITDYGDKLQSGDITQSTKPIFLATVLDTDIVGVSANELRLATVINVELNSVVRTELRHLTGCGDDVHTNQESVEVDICVSDSQDSFILANPYQDNRPLRLIAVETNLIIKSTKPSIDCVICDGVVYCNIIAEVEGGMLKGIMHTIPFNQEIVASGMTQDSRCVSFITISNTVAKQEQDGGAISIDVHLNARTVGFKKTVFTPVVDAFSLFNTLEVSHNTAQIASFDHCAFYDERVEGAITLADDLPLADTICASIAGKLNLTKCMSEKDNILIEGVVNGNIVYYNQDKNAKFSVAIELPFALSLPANNVRAGDNINAHGCVSAINARLRRGNEIELKADVGINVIVTTASNKQFITEISKGEPLSTQVGAFSIHIAKPDETLWDIAKSLRATPQQVIEQNPSLAIPLIGGERVIAYRQLSKRS